MDKDILQIRRLGNESNSVLESFHCKDVPLNNFLRRKAKKHQKEMLSVTYLLYFNEEIVGYYSLSADTILATEKELTKFPKGKTYKTYPAIKIGRLAIAEKYSRQNIGSWLLDAVKFKYANEPQSIGIRYLVVDSLAGSTIFYEKNKFQYWTEKDRAEKTRLMYFDLKSAKI